jgi:hypothetical protein
MPRKLVGISFVNMRREEIRFTWLYRGWISQSFNLSAIPDHRDLDILLTLP